MFTGKEHRGLIDISEELGNLSAEAQPAAEALPAQIYEANDVDLLLSTSEKEEIRGPVSNSSAYRAPDYDSTSAALVSSPVPLEAALSIPGLPAYTPQVSSAIDDLLGLGLSVAPTPAPAPPPPLELNPKAALDPGSFQRKWSQLAIASSQVRSQGAFKLISSLFIGRFIGVRKKKKNLGHFLFQSRFRSGV